MIYFIVKVHSSGKNFFSRHCVQGINPLRKCFDWLSDLAYANASISLFQRHHFNTIECLRNWCCVWKFRMSHKKYSLYTEAKSSRDWNYGVCCVVNGVTWAIKTHAQASISRAYNLFVHIKSRDCGKIIWKLWTARKTNDWVLKTASEVERYFLGLIKQLKFSYIGRNWFFLCLGLCNSYKTTHSQW